MPATSPTPGRRRRLAARSERGAALVEAAIILPLTFAIILGMLEMGLYWRDSLTLSDAVREGARIGSEYGADPTADYYILAALKQASAALPNGRILQVVVYNAADPDPANSAAQDPPAACTTSGSTGQSVNYSGNAGAVGSCNVYYPSDFNRPVTDWTNATSSNFPGAVNWQGTERITSSGASRGEVGAIPGPDYVGVWVLTQHGWVTGVIGNGTSTITDRTVYKIEPIPGLTG